MKPPFISALEERTLLGDGAMGTLLISRGARHNSCLEALVIDEPDLVRRVHQDYIAAGADFIETNTFGANRYRLARHGREADVRDINFRAARLARDAREISGHPVFVAGAVGPTNMLLAGDARPDEVREAFRGGEIERDLVESPVERSESGIAHPRDLAALAEVDHRERLQDVVELRARKLDGDRPCPARLAPMLEVADSILVEDHLFHG